MARKNSLMDLAIVGGGSFVVYQLGVRGSFGKDFQTLMVQLRSSLGGLAKAGTLPPTGGGGGQLPPSTDGWKNVNGVWTSPKGRVFVQAEADGTFTAVFQDSSGNYTVIVGHTDQGTAERAVNQFIGQPN